MKKYPLPVGSEGHTNSDRHYGTYQDNILLSMQYINISSFKWVITQIKMLNGFEPHKSQQSEFESDWWAPRTWTKIGQIGIIKVNDSQKQVIELVQIRPHQWHSFGRGKMGRVSYELSEDNRRRLELLTAFGILNGRCPTRDEIVNESIRQYFKRVYEDYCNKADANDFMKRMMEEVVQ